jgi:hypothetical protein
MLTNTYNNYIFYCHNFGKYDVVFLYLILLEANKSLAYEHYILKRIMRDGVIIKLDIKVKNKNSFIKISFVDSLNLLKGSLENLAFDVYNKKGKFPYTFVNDKNLNYIGKTPDISYYKNISENDYNKLIKKE